MLLFTSDCGFYRLALSFHVHARYKNTLTISIPQKISFCPQFCIHHNLFSLGALSNMEKNLNKMAQSDHFLLL